MPLLPSLCHLLFPNKPSPCLTAPGLVVSLFPSSSASLSTWAAGHKGQSPHPPGRVAGPKLGRELEKGWSPRDVNCEVLHNCHMAQPEFEEKSANCKFVSLSTFTISSFKNGFPDGSMGKESACNAGGTGFEALGQEDLLEEENGNPLQYSWLEKPMDRGL